MTLNEGLTLGIALLSLVVAGLSAAFSKKSADSASEQLAFVQRKIGMVTDPSKMTEVLPTWYMDRMSTDVWGFGLLLSSGDILGIESIHAVSDDGQWLEVRLLEEGAGPDTFGGERVFYAGLSDRKHASVRVDQVQAAFEIITS